MQREKMTSYYQEIAPDYARHRRVHPEVLRHLREDGAIHGESRVLEVGCGTGNYTCSLRESTGCHAWGIDPSEQMLAQAMGRSPTVQVISGRAEKVPFADEFFDLTFSVDVVHHIVDRPQAFNEAWRALRPNGRICIVTDSGDILRTRQPQSIYFPESVDVELSRYPSIELLRKELAEAHFGEFSEVVVEFSSVLPDLEPYRAKVFSSLRLISDDAFALGMARLEKDFRKGLIPWVSRYLMLWGRKLPR